jgi:hypothetical protein
MSESVSFLNYSLDSGYRLDSEFEFPSKKPNMKSKRYNLDPYITENKVLINVCIFILCMTFMQVIYEDEQDLMDLNLEP